MAELLLVNPRARRKAPRRAASVSRSRPKRRRNPIARASSVRTLPLATVRRRRRRNPVGRVAVSRGVRRRNPIAAVRRRVSRRRRNPIGMPGLNIKALMDMMKDGAIGGAGAISMDLLMGQLNKYIPITFQTIPGLPGVGNAVKAGLTAVIGIGLQRQTKGLSRKMAEGALAVQAYDILKTLLPESMAMGYYTPAALVQGSARVGPIRKGMNRYLPQGGKSPLLAKYMQPGASPLLSRGAKSSAESEGFAYR